MPKQWAAWDGMKVVPRRGPGPEQAIKVLKSGQYGTVFALQTADGEDITVSFPVLIAEFKPAEKEKTIPAGVTPAMSISVEDRWKSIDGETVVGVERLAYHQNAIPTVWYYESGAPLKDDMDLPLAVFLERFVALAPEPAPAS